MAQQGIAKTISKEYLFKMSDTEIVAWSPSEQGIVVSGKTTFFMDINTTTPSGRAIIASNYTIPDFTKTLIGTLTLDENTPIVELRKVPIEEAKRLIHQYLKEHPGSRTSDLIIELALEPDIVIETLSQLRNEGKVEGRDVSHK